MKLASLTLLIAVSTSFAHAPDPAAVIVFSDSSGYACGETLAEDGWIRNRESETVVLLSTGSLIAVPKGNRYHIPAGMKPRAWYFDYTLDALKSMEAKWDNLVQDLELRFPDTRISTLPDTVEGRLVYPIGAAIIEIPDAFKWNLDEKPVDVSINEGHEPEPVFSVQTYADSILRPQFVDLVKPDRIYTWRISGAESTDSTWFSLLSEDELFDLSDQLSVFERVEELDGSPEVKFGWLVLRVAVLVQRNLYYEARAQIRKFREDNPDADKRVDKLMRKVRMIQRYGLPPESIAP